MTVVKRTLIDLRDQFKTTLKNEIQIRKMKDEGMIQRVMKIARNYK